MSRLTSLVTADYAGVSGVYLLAFVRGGEHVAYGAEYGPHGFAGHYCGWALDIGRRLAEHQSGTGARLTRAVRRAGYELHLVRVWPGATRTDERQIKDSHKLSRVCPWCHLNLAPIPMPPAAPIPVPLLTAADVLVS